MKHAKHWLITVAMLLCSMTVSAQYFEMEGIEYLVISINEVKVTSNYATKYSGAVVIPSSVTNNNTNYNVTEIGSSAFSDCEELASITIPASVTSIGDYAFNGCSGLKEVILEDGSTTLSLGISSYNQGLFYDCPLERVYMGRDLDYASWEYSPFQDKTKLSSLTIGEMVTTIGDCCFRGCSSLTSIAIPDGVTTIENNAFRDCSSLDSFTGGKGVTQWGGWVLYGCNNLTEITIDCINCSFSNSLESSSIRKIILGENVENISPAFFSYSGNLTSIEVSENNPIYDSRQDCNAIIETSTNRLIVGCSTSVIPNSITSIGDNAFMGCYGLTSINIPTTVTSIGDGAFSYCTGLTSISIPENVISIPNYAFERCSNLVSINIPEGVTSIGENAFYECSGLTSITIPQSVSEIGDDAFYGCENHLVINYSDLDIQKNSTDYGYIGYKASRIVKTDQIIDDYGFESIDNVHYLTGYIGNDTELFLPQDYNGECYQIGDRAFENCSNITSITIPNSVTAIGEEAFAGCVELREVVFEDGVETLYFAQNSYDRQSLFHDCPLEHVYIGRNLNIDWNPNWWVWYSHFKNANIIEIGNSVTTIAHHTFSGCSNLISITIPEGVTSIGNYAFEGCSSLTSVTIPENSQLTSIGNEAFIGCLNLNAITIPEGATNIGDGAFRYCGKLTSINIPKGITDIGNETFEGCDKLTQVTFDCANVESWFSEKSSIKEVILGKNVETIGDYAFSGCSDITSINIPEGVTSIGNYAFEGCSSLTSVNIPKGITEIGYDAFEDCNELTQVTFDCANIGSWFSGKSSIKEVILGENVKTIGDYAFSGCSGITSINIPEGVTSIGYEAFNRCESLAAVHINSIEAWCKITFGGDGWHDSNSNPLSYAHNLYLNGDLVTELVIPEGVTSIRSQVFSGCTNITSVSIPESVTSIENGAFNGCENLAEVHINSLEAWCNIDFGSNPLSYAKNLYLNGELVTDLVIPSTITSIKSYAFKNCQNLTSVVIPEGVTSIGSSAFEGCSGITSINIPEGVTSIGGSALSSCSSLTSITIPGSVTSIDWAVFSGCNSLTSVTIHEGVTELDYYTFNECNSLISITLPESITSLNGEVFEDCSNLTAVTILGSLTQVDGEPFRGCNNLKEMVFGEKVRKIEAGAFAEVESLEKITVYATQPPRTDGDIFSDEVYDNATLYVPQGCISKYQVMTGWSGFYNISEIEGSTPNYLTIRQADNGAVKIAVDLGRTYKVQIEPTEGWAIHSVTFDGTDMTAQLDENYTFTTPTLTGSAILNVAYEQTASKVEEAHSRSIKVRGHEGIIYIEGTEQGDHIAIYTTDGTAVAETQAEGSNTKIAVESRQLYIVQVANKVVKILM